MKMIGRSPSHPPVIMLNISDLVILGKNLETNKGASVWPRKTLAVALIDSHGL